ncbi:SIS domain-containing protein [Parabacteroides chongii]|jgi:tagatose-6-phosphate ketose/aldose isomerase|nr:SIS domain-containing protein [Parabacteroides chongii]WFE85211.1 SIS domain-containing protein [Parabacteroides chongii]
MKYFCPKENNNKKMKDNQFFTYKEIMQQPKMWLKVYELVLQQRVGIESFISQYTDRNYQIIYTGAGTSAYIGNILEIVLSESNFRGARSVSTTDLITNHHAYINENQPVLLISFARSGNSPESAGAIKIVNTHCKHTAHIYITCNKEGELAKNADKENTLLLLLPPETNDLGLAMTSSFSSMLLTALLVANIQHIDTQLPYIQSLTLKAQKVLSTYAPIIREIMKREFSRVVFLGSGELKGIAEESRLKLQELTDGKIVCQFDSFLGFRHGPKAIINKETVLVYLFSGDEHIRRYETDLVKQINTNNKVTAQIIVSETPVKTTGIKSDLEVIFSEGDSPSIYDCIPYVIVAQLMGFYKSLEIGLNPDTPSVSGNISRIVEGVILYDNL